MRGRAVERDGRGEAVGMPARHGWIADSAPGGMEGMSGRCAIDRPCIGWLKFVTTVCS